ncbi:dienelactone hydrolase [Shewanella sp. NFH-SH190041]|uniref:alpha/beta fold hydrolase n=1 Tax=Shewanella sp. NFH-SH190041 TaxID=2950245 RepID=UPI0021C34A0F|nr:alpha/beta fold hydrolase [Shewanella sp. NFH-SH190041]BDM65227.1 dienelactone hydrolase [Shewanella sp. NFH-SH190041]
MNCFRDNIVAGRILVDGEPLLSSGRRVILFAHGAGADMHHSFMAQIAADLARQGGYSVVRFNFPYMQQRQLDGKRRPPDKAEKLQACFGDYLTQLYNAGAGKVILMGKSMGGRMAAMLAAQPEYTAMIAGVVCLGYPFLPPAKRATAEPRLAPLQQVPLPTLVIQGERDSFGNQAQLATWSLGQQVETVFLPDGDHSFIPRKRSGFTLDENMAQACRACQQFIGACYA